MAQKEGNNMERKSLSNIELKADSEGTFTARISTLNVVDSDGDLTIAGAFPSKSVLVSAYQHGSWSGGLPVGKAVINESGNDVLAEGQFNLNSAGGKEHYEVIKFAPELQEWSYGFKVLDYERDVEVDGIGKVERILKSLEVIEISPVLRGAGINTATLAVKSLTYAGQAETVLAAVTDLAERTKSLATLRRNEGRDLSAANKDRIQGLLEKLSEIACDLKELLESSEPADVNAVNRLYLDYQKIRTLVGVL